ncbi:MAG: 50S ribosomal protein L11 [Planctomycetota bacterium]|nr:50S ribosomal protein L11 [Planctomycetota bacterium]
MAKQIIAKVKLQCPGGSANPAPPVGPALSQHGVNIGDFVKRFNADTAKKKGVKIPVIVTVYQDKSIDLLYKEPPVSALILQELGAEKGSGVPNKEKVGKLSSAQVKKIAEQKIKDLNTRNLDAACRLVKGTARSMGVDCE